MIYDIVEEATLAHCPLPLFVVDGGLQLLSVSGRVHQSCYVDRGGRGRDSIRKLMAYHDPVVVESVRMAAAEGRQWCSQHSVVVLPDLT